MSKWEMQSRRLVVHRDGHQIELKSGSWAEPFEIHPKIVRGTASLESVRLIREGMEFAEACIKTTGRAEPA